MQFRAFVHALLLGLTSFSPIVHQAKSFKTAQTSPPGEAFPDFVGPGQGRWGGGEVQLLHPGYSDNAVHHSSYYT